MSLSNLETADQRLTSAPLLARDHRNLERYLQAIHTRWRRQQPIEPSLQKWQAQWLQACKTWSRFQASTLQLHYPADLPVSSRREDILQVLAQHPVTIICGDTGSGKTTQLPKMLYEAGAGHHGRIGVTQPRRLAATEMARRVAAECQVPYGQGVGASVRFNDLTTPDTRIQFMTDGLLLSKMPSDPDWLEYGALLIDEAHERSLNIDFLLGYLKGLVKRRPDLKVVISSATLDAERFAEFFDQAPVIQVEGRLYPIQDIALPPDPKRDLDLPDQVAEALEITDREHGPQDTLVFLPGEREIRELARKLEGRFSARADILPLFARLGATEQRRVFSTSSRRRIILATNVAETSLTLPGIRRVIDTGLVRLQRFHPQSRIQRLVTEQISQASARQRRGRCGRTGPGVCVRLYSEDTLEKAPAHTDPEIRRDSLAEVILRMAVLGLPPLRDFPLLDPPKGAQINEGIQTLLDIGAMDEQKRITPRGRRLASFALDPRLARMLEEGHQENVLPATLICVAYLSMQDPRERPAEHTAAADAVHKVWQDPGSDFIGVLEMWNAVQTAGTSRSARRRFCQSHFLHAQRVEEWLRLVDDLRETCDTHHWHVPASIGEVELLDTDGLHRSLLAGIPRSVGEREENRAFRAPNGKSFRAFPGSGLASKPPRWIMGFTLLETSSLYARECAAIQPEWIEQVAPHLCKAQYERPVWNAKRGFVEAEERLSLGPLTLRAGRKIHYGRIDPEEARRIFLRDGLGPGKLPFAHPSLDRYRERLSTLESWEHKLRRPGWFLSTDMQFRYLDRMIPRGIHTAKQFQTWCRKHDWVPEIADLVEQPGLSTEDFPDRLCIGGVQVEVCYRYTPDIPEQDGLHYRVREADLIQLNDALLEWVVPGWREEQLTALIRQLDKPLRLACQPIRETVAALGTWLQEQSFAYTHSLAQAVAAFLAVRLDRIVGAADVKPDSLPLYLQPGMEVIDSTGKTAYRGRTFPGRSDLPEFRNTLPQGADLWSRTGLQDWPDVDLSSSVSLPSGAKGYLALTDQTHSCGVKLFQRPEEANAAHAQGVTRLFCLRQPDVVRYLQKSLPLPTSLQLDLTTLPGDHTREDVVDGILQQALTGSQGLPRTRETFETAMEEARGNLFEVAEQRTAQLLRIFEERHQTLKALEASLPPDTRQDIDLQWETLWAPGWCREPETIRRIPHYLKGIQIRVQRCLQNPGKDAQKQGGLEEPLNRLATALPSLSPHQIRIALGKLQEIRLQLFAPEIGSHEKISPKRFLCWLEEEMELGRRSQTK